MVGVRRLRKWFSPMLSLRPSWKWSFGVPHVLPPRQKRPVENLALRVLRFMGAKLLVFVLLLFPPEGHWAIGGAPPPRLLPQGAPASWPGWAAGKQKLVNSFRICLHECTAHMPPCGRILVDLPQISSLAAGFRIEFCPSKLVRTPAGGCESFQKKKCVLRIYSCSLHRCTIPCQSIIVG